MHVPNYRNEKLSLLYQNDVFISQVNQNSLDLTTALKKLEDVV